MQPSSRTHQQRRSPSVPQGRSPDSSCRYADDDSRVDTPTAPPLAHRHTATPWLHQEPADLGHHRQPESFKRQSLSSSGSSHRSSSSTLYGESARCVKCFDAACSSSVGSSPPPCCEELHHSSDGDTSTSTSTSDKGSPLEPTKGVYEAHHPPEGHPRPTERNVKSPGEERILLADSRASLSRPDESILRTPLASLSLHDKRSDPSPPALGRVQSGNERPWPRQASATANLSRDQHASPGEQALHPSGPWRDTLSSLPPQRDSREPGSGWALASNGRLVAPGGEHYDLADEIIQMQIPPGQVAPPSSVNRESPVGKHDDAQLVAQRLEKVAASVGLPTDGAWEEAFPSSASPVGRDEGRVPAPSPSSRANPNVLSSSPPASASGRSIPSLPSHLRRDQHHPSTRLRSITPPSGNATATAQSSYSYGAGGRSAVYQPQQRDTPGLSQTTNANSAQPLRRPPLTSQGPGSRVPSFQQLRPSETGQPLFLPTASRSNSHSPAPYPSGYAPVDHVRPSSVPRHSPIPGLSPSPSGISTPISTLYPSLSSSPVPQFDRAQVDASLAAFYASLPRTGSEGFYPTLQQLQGLLPGEERAQALANAKFQAEMAGGSTAAGGAVVGGPSANNRKLGLYKTECCLLLSHNSKCQFAHGTHELRSVQRHPKYKTEICRTFWRTGSCPYAKRCCFIHTTMPGASTEQVENQPDTLQKAPLLARVGGNNKQASSPTSPTSSGQIDTTDSPLSSQSLGRPSSAGVLQGRPGSGPGSFVSSGSNQDEPDQVRSMGNRSHHQTTPSNAISSLDNSQRERGPTVGPPLPLTQRDLEWLMDDARLHNTLGLQPSMGDLRKGAVPPFPLAPGQPSWRAQGSQERSHPHPHPHPHPRNHGGAGMGIGIGVGVGDAAGNPSPNPRSSSSPSLPSPARWSSPWKANETERDFFSGWDVPRAT